MKTWLGAAALVVLATVGWAEDRYVGYYYPSVDSEETFARVMRGIPAPQRSVRVDFITQLTVAQLKAPANPRFVFFTKGEEADRLIIVALDDDVFKTLFRARAVLAQMTSNTRNSGFFQDLDLQYSATFLDLLQLLGFSEMVISDGDSWAHRVVFERN